jgi:hypothetical protein
MKYTVLYGSARMGDYLIVAIKKSQRVPFPGRHDCRWTAACTNETHRNKWVRAHERLSPPYLWMKPSPPINTQNLCPLWRSTRCMIVKYWFRELKNVLLSTTVLRKNRSNESFKDRLWGEVREAVVSEWSQLDGPENREKGRHCCF